MKCEKAPSGLYIDKKNSNIECHVADNDINFDFFVFIQEYKEAIIEHNKNYDSKLSLGKMLIQLLSRQIFQFCVICGKVFSLD